LLDPRNPGDYNYSDLKFDKRPFYVGKGCGNRCHRHFTNYEFKRAYNGHKNNIIGQILKSGFSKDDCIVIWKENLSETESLALEKEIIEKIGCTSFKTGPLCNKTSGGEDFRSHLKGKTWEDILGVEQAKIRKENVSKSKKGVRTGIPASTRKWVVSIDKYFSVDYYESVCHAAAKFQCKPRHIRNAILLRKNTHSKQNRIFFYKKDFDQMSEMEIKQRMRYCFSFKKKFFKPVLQINPQTLEVVNVFESRSAAALYIYGNGSKAGRITTAIKQESLTAGFFWKESS